MKTISIKNIIVLIFSIIIFHAVALAQTVDDFHCKVGGGIEDGNGVAVSLPLQVKQGQVINWINDNWTSTCNGNAHNCNNCNANPGLYIASSSNVWWNNSGNFDVLYKEINGSTSCNDYTCQLEVNVIPAYNPGEFNIEGASSAFSACEYTYSVPEHNNEWLEYRWNIGSASLVQDNGNSITVSFPSGNGTTNISCEVYNPQNYASVPSDFQLYYHDIAVSYSDFNSVELLGYSGANSGSTFCPDGSQNFSYELQLNSVQIPNNTQIIWESPYGTEISSYGADKTSINLVFHDNAVSGHVQVELNFPCGGSLSRNLWIEITPPMPKYFDILGPKLLVSGASNVTYTVPEIPNAIDYTWSLLGQSVFTTGNTAQFSFGSPGTQTLQVTPNGPCGPGTPISIQIEVFPYSIESCISSIPVANHTSLDNANGGGVDFVLKMNPSCELNPCVNMELDESFLELQLDLGEMYEFGKHNQSKSVSMQVDILMFDDYTGGNIVSQKTAYLSIDDSKPRAKFQVNTSKDFLKIKRYELSITNYTADIDFQPAVRFQADYYADWKIDARSTNPFIDVSSLSANQIDGKFNFQWDLNCPDLVFNNYEIQILRIKELSDDLENGNYENHDVEDDGQMDFNVDWEKALMIETQSNETSIDLTIAEGTGLYLWRVRPIGNFFEGGIADDRNWGLFSEIGNYENGTYKGEPNGNFVFSATQIDEELNWIYSRVFVEAEADPEQGVKIGERMNYANGLNQSLINQSLSNENGLIINQSLYDYSGRPVLQTLPCPVDYQTSFGFNPLHLMKDEASQDLYGPQHFDECSNYLFPHEALDNSTTVQAYYSDNNTDDPIADAEGYPFARTVFGNDGRVKEQSSPGLSLKLNGEIGHTTKTFFSGVMQDELLRIFGDEAPLSINCQKVITVDANGTATGMYRTKSGETIATFLIDNGNNPYPLTDEVSNIAEYQEGLDNLSYENGPLVGLDSKLNSFVAYEVIDNHIPFGQNGVQTSTVVTSSEDDQYISLDYTLTPSIFYNDCSTIDFCTKCDYFVTIKVLPLEFDICTGSIEDQIILSEEYLFPGSNSSDCNPSEITWSTTEKLGPAGSYQILLTVQTHNTDPSTISVNDINGQSYLQSGLDALEEILTTGYRDGLFDDLNGVLADANGDPFLLPGSSDFTPVINPDFSLDEMYAHWIDNGLPLNVSIQNDDDGQIQYFEFLPAGACEPIIIPYLPCGLIEADCINFDFEADFDDYWASQYANDPNLTGPQPLFPDLFTNSVINNTPFPSSSFSIMVSNMILEKDLNGNSLYSCNDIMACWEFLRNNYLNMTTGYTEQGAEYDFITEFLSCTGTYYYGFTDNSGLNNQGAVYGSDGIQNTIANFNDPASYITHAYAFFYHPFMDEQSLPIDELAYCYTNCLWEESSGNVMNCLVPGFATYEDNVSQNGGGNFDFTLWSWNDPSLNREDINTIWYLFSTCVSNLQESIASGAITDPNIIGSNIQKVNDLMISSCLDKCNSLYSNFYQNIIDEYHNQGKYVEGDLYYLEPQFEIESHYNSYTQFLNSNSYSWPENWEQIRDHIEIQNYEVNWVPHEDYPINLNEVSSDLIINTCEIECLTAALVQNCKDACVPSWYNADPDGNGIIGEVPQDGNGNIDPEAMNELLAIQEILISTHFDIQIPNPGDDCLPGYEHICIYEPASISYGNGGPGTPFYQSQITDPVSNELCSTCSNTPGALEYAWGLNSALNNFIPFIANSISAQSYIPYKGWDFVDLGNNTGRFEWTWDHPYFNDPSCPSDLLKIIISLSYKCNVSDSPQSIIADAHLPNILSQLRIFDISIQLTSDPSDLVFYSRPGLYCTGINGTYLNPTIHDMEQIAPLPFTNSHFAFGVNNSGDLIIDLASSPYDYYGTYFNVGSNTEDAYFMHWAMAHEYCDLPSDADPLPQLQTNYAFQACIPFYDLLPACPRNCPEFSAEICFDWQMTPVPKELELPTPLLCEDENTNQVLTSVTVQLQELISDQLNGHYQNYLDVCANPDNINDELKYGMELGYHHYTLFYYDRAGNLITTVPPEGVDLQDDPAPGNSFSRVSLDHRMKTEYHYNSLNQLTAQETPDGGLSHFTYNDIGQLRFSQNAQQQIDGTFSYTKYDELARIVEAGVCLGDFSLVSDPIYSNDNSYPQSNVSEVVQTTYSRPYADLAISQSFLQNRVSYSVRLGDNGEDDITTVYSYDAHGNVDKLYQIIPAIGIKCMQYEYDLVSGNVLKVAYQKGERDQFFHKYSYDSDNRIESAMTSRDGLLWDKDGSYDYYKHGPLKRTEIGEDKVQGLDFIYTLNGWLKSINHPSLMVSYDINEDGKHDSSIAKDVFGMQLNYFDGDYKRSNGYGIILDSSHPVTASIDNHRSLYNGNISSWFSQVTFPNSNNSSIEHNGKMIGYTYTYDELNRLVLAKFNHYSGSWNENFDYNSLYVYDANGNIEFLRRTGPSSDLFDDLTYHYHEVNGEKINNRLYHFKDDGVASAYDDLKDLPSNYDNANAETANNFRYDALGNLIQDDSEEIQLIDWLANGKIAAVLRPSGASGKSDLYFNYDALGNRISKKVVAKSNNYPLPESEWTWTYYVRDASGNIMATYDRIHSTTNEGYNKKIKWAESPIYGSSRLGVLSTNELLSDVDVNTSTGDEVELANYDIGSLGTVLVSIDDDNNTSTPIVVGGTAGQLNVLESYGSFTGTPSPAIYTQNDALGAIEFSIMGLNDNEECTIKILDANGVVMSGSELMNASTQSEIQVFPLDDIGLYQLFTLDTDQHLLQHKFNPSINGSGDVLVEHNVNIAPGRLFRSKMLAFENEGVNTLMVREKISGDNDQLVLFHFDRSNGNFINEENLGIPFESDDLDEDYGIRMTEDALKISFSSNSLIDEGRGTGQFHIYQRWNTSTAFDPMGVIQAKHNGEVGDVEFSANGAYLYYIEYTAYEVYLNQYALHTGAHEVIMEREVNGAASNLLLSNIGELYISNFNASALMSVTNSNQPAPSVSPGEEELVWGDQLLGISVNLPNIPIDLISAGLPFAYANRIIDNKKYELTDHLGNVRVVISDVKTHLQTDANGLPFEFEAIVLSASDYYPFGMLIPGREDQGANNNRFAFNGREKDDEIAGAGNFIIYMERGYDPRIARWKSVDGAASKYPSFSTYSFTLNNPIAHSEIDGNVIETGWDVFNVGLDIVSIGVNIYSGNYFDALVDVGALAYDVGATIVPGLPAGAGAALKASRAGRVVLKVIKHSDNLYKVGERAFRSANKAADYTKIVNDKFEGSVKLANAFWDAGKGGANKLAKALKTAGTGKKAHHIIPTTLLEKNKYVKQAVEEGFDFNGIVNGIGLDKTRHKGGHFDYTEAVNNMINKAFTNPKNADKSATEILQSVSTKLKSKIENSTGDINQLFTK